MTLPVLTTFSSPLSTDRPTFRWSVVPRASGYVLEVTDMATKQAVINQAVNSTSYTPTKAQALTPGHTYEWSASAVSPSRGNRMRGGSQTFMIASLQAPQSLSVSLPTFTWHAVTDAAQYDLKIMNSAGQAVVTQTVPAPSEGLAVFHELTSSQLKTLKS